MNNRKLAVPWLLAGFIVILDQVTKWAIQSRMELHQSIEVIGQILRITYIHNDGLAFGVDTPLGRWLGVLSLVATLVVAVLLVKMRTSPLSHQMFLGGIMGGAIGNTIDRLLYGYVIDFIDVDLPDWMMERWPVFNVADSAVSVGVIFLVIVLLFYSTPPEEETTPVAEEKPPEE